MSARAIFFDRDGTLNRDHAFTYQIKDLEIIENVVPALQKLKSDYDFFIVTNQSGVKRGLFSLEEAEKFTSALLEELKKSKIDFKKFYICPHHPNENCECRKPKAKFLLEASKEFQIDLKSSWVIGDRGSDIELAKRAGTSSILVLTGVNFSSLQEIKSLGSDYIAADLLEAANFIEAEKTISKIISRDQISKVIQQERSKGRKIVTLNGSFDLLHEGHQKILAEAKAQGDILLVALNSDASIQTYKSPDRPLNSENSRLRRMSAFSEVDYVTLFSETTPLDLLEDIRPDVHVNGSEYGENCIEAPLVKKYGGRIHIVKLVEGRSTSALLQSKIHKK
ncbi:MAG: HAD-IIIA family hydrolase [Deltaproteobacteria bacterium]|nr:HAD-IIIA family hydrolase [Deltaproteobacteria bacterium]